MQENQNEKRLFVSLLRYKKIPQYEIDRIKKVLEIEGWQDKFLGFHPMIDISLNRLIMEFPNTTISVVDGEADIAKARATNLGIWKKMWDERDRHEYFLVLDDDIEFRPQGVRTLIENNKPVGAGIYTFKSKLPPRAGMPTCRFYEGEVGTLDAPFKIRWAAGGFILVRANVLHQMIEKYQHLKYNLPEHYKTKNQSVGFTWDLWQQHIFEHDGQKERMSEDYAFCQRIHDIGFDVWADWRVKLYHWDGETGYGLTPIPKEVENGLHDHSDGSKEQEKNLEEAVV